MRTERRQNNRRSPLQMLVIGIGLCCSVLLLLLLIAAGAQSDSVPAGFRQTESGFQNAAKKKMIVTDADRDGLLDVPYLSQAGTMPTGCELVSAAMVLQFYGYDLDAQTFANTYVKMEPLEWNDGLLVGPSPNDAFVGSPWDSGSFGCYAPVVAEAMQNVIGSDYMAKITTGTPLDILTTRYINKGKPVLVWVSINMQPTYSGCTWQLKNCGEPFTWIAREHCMVLVGSDPNGYYLMDPYDDNGLVYYDKAVVEQRFAELGQQSVVLTERE